MTIWPLRSVWDVWKWSQWISHAWKPGDGHQNQVSSPLQTEITFCGHFGGFRSKIWPLLSFFFNFLGFQTRFWATYDFVLWMAFKKRYLGPFKVVPRSSRRSLMSQTFMTLFLTKFQHTRLILQFRLSKIFFFQKPSTQFWSSIKKLAPVFFQTPNRPKLRELEPKM